MKPPDNLFMLDYEEKPANFASIVSSASADLCENDMSEGTGCITMGANSLSKTIHKKSIMDIKLIDSGLLATFGRDYNTPKVNTYVE